MGCPRYAMWMFPRELGRSDMSRGQITTSAPLVWFDSLAPAIYACETCGCVNLQIQADVLLNDPGDVLSIDLSYEDAPIWCPHCESWETRADGFAIDTRGLSYAGGDLRWENEDAA